MVGKWGLFKKEPILVFDKLVVRSHLGPIILRRYAHALSSGFAYLIMIVIDIAIVATLLCPKVLWHLTF